MINSKPGLARLRDRFATTPDSKARDAVVSIDRMTRGQGEVIKHISDSYRDLHGIYDVGPTVGFTDIGEAARTAE